MDAARIIKITASNLWSSVSDSSGSMVFSSSHRVRISYERLKTTVFIEQREGKGAMLHLDQSVESSRSHHPVVLTNRSLLAKRGEQNCHFRGWLAEGEWASENERY